MKGSHHRIVLWLLAALVLGATGGMAVRSVRWRDSYGLNCVVTYLEFCSREGSFTFSKSKTSGFPTNWDTFDLRTIPDEQGSYPPKRPRYFAQFLKFRIESSPFSDPRIVIGYAWILMLEALIFSGLFWGHRRAAGVRWRSNHD